MKKASNLFPIVLLFISGFHACTTTKVNEPLKAVSFTRVHLTDQFWAPKIEINRTVSIPSAFQKSEETGRMDNFALAGGLIEKEHQGDFPFDDTDVYKILEGASYSLAATYDAVLDHYVDSLIYLIGIGQEKDGYLCTCVTNKCERLTAWYGKGRWDRLNSHELYNCGHLYEAAVAHFEATGKRTLLNIAIKNADLVHEKFGPAENQKQVPSGHPIIEMALVKLYRVTNDKKYLKLAQYFIDETGKGTDGHHLNEYSQDHMPIVEQDEALGHAVRLGYLYSGVTDVASLMNNKALLEASIRVWDNVVSKKLYITGGIGQRAQGEGFGQNYELPNMTNYCETCASIANVYWNFRLFLNEKDAKYFDVLERTLYNGVISGVSLSGDRFFYENALESAHTNDRAPWFGCACCPGNITRFMASVPGYVYATDAKSIYVNLFANSESIIAIGKETVKLSQFTNYPWDGKVLLKVDSLTSNDFDLKIRIPGWVKGEAVPSDLYQFIPSASNYQFKLNGKKFKLKEENGYVRMHEKWKIGDVIELDFPMNVQKIVTIDRVSNNKNKLAYQRGPIVYCFEDKDNQDDWMFNYFVSDKVEVEANFNPDLLNGVVTLKMNGEKVMNKHGEKVEEAVSITAIPYYAWNNRGTSNMLVWMPINKNVASVKRISIASDLAIATASTNWAPGLNDGFDPKSSNDIDKAYFYWWLKKGSEEWVQYDFDKPTLIHKSSVYWLNFDHYDGDFRAPESWYLEYQNGNGNWKSVETSDAYNTFNDVYNEINFAAVKAKAIRLNAKLKKDFSGGILEWKIE